MGMGAIMILIFVTVNAVIESIKDRLQKRRLMNKKPSSKEAAFYFLY
jgi:hypothetical protein